MKIMPKNALLLCLSLILTTAVVFTQNASAKDKDKDTEHITFTEPISVGGTVLEEGDYKLEWQGTGPDVQVAFMKGSKTLVTAPARLVVEPSGFDGAVQAKTVDNKSKALERILWKKKSLIFETSS